MNLKDILAKVNKGETLTAEEKTFLADYDPQREMDSVATAARKKAEADAKKASDDLAAAQAQLAEATKKLAEAGDKGKTDLQKLQDQMATISKQLESATADKAKLVRQQKLDEAIRSTGLQFVPEVDANIMRRALEGEFAGLTDEDILVPEKTKPIVETFRARNKAVILDSTGHGAGMPPHTPGSPAAPDNKAIEAMTPEQRKADLKTKGIL